MEDLTAMAETFRRFAALECPGMSLWYETLSRNIAEDQELLEIAAKRQPG